MIDGSALRRALAISVCAGLAAAFVTVPSAQADTVPASGVPETVTADALPTVQVDGVVWSQVTVGNTVYATGDFDYARPPGTAATDTSRVARGNLLAYDITTGNLITSFNHTMNGQGLVVVASPDGKTVYVGGDFTTVDSVSRPRVAAFDVATDSLLPWTANVANQVRAIAVSASAVYLGGNFFAANGVKRTRLAAYTPRTTASLLSWAPTSDDESVAALVLSPDQSKVIVGGKFSTLNGVQRRGIGAVSATTGATATWNAAFPLYDYGQGAGFTSLSSDGTTLFGTGYNYSAGGGTGNFEGRFASDFDGNLTWLSSCHGDSYSVYTLGGVLYSASHAHDCSDIGSWEDTTPRTWHRALGESVAGSGRTLLPNNNSGYANFAGLPAGRLLQWYPSMSVGTFTGQSQAAWSVTGNSTYLSWGGEFPRINGVAQQGLVRFAVKSVAANKSGPFSTAAMTPRVSSPGDGIARVSWGATWDMDNELLTYRVYRNGATTAVYETQTRSSFWSLPSMSFTDRNLPAGSSQSYRVKAFDPCGNQISSPASASVVVSGAAEATSAYQTDVRAAGATSYWTLGESTGALRDEIGGNDLTDATGVVRGATGALVGDADPAVTFDGSSNAYAAGPATALQSGEVTVQAWVRTTSVSGGRVVGLGNAQTGNSSFTDLNMYVDDNGRVLFGALSGGVKKVTASPGKVNDGRWHQVTGTVGSAGLALYVDGRLAKRIGSVNEVQPSQSTAYWRVGGDQISGWAFSPSAPFPTASIDEVAIYSKALKLSQIQQQFRDSGRSLAPTAPADSYGATVYASEPDLFYRLNDSSGVTAEDAGPNQLPARFSGGAVSYRVSSPVTANGAATGFDGNTATLTNSGATITDPGTFSTEMWFSTTTTRGGKLIGFGNAATGASTSYDRQVYMGDDGRLNFGTYTGPANKVSTATTTRSYNDGGWHHMVATQGSDGMKLYVDGALVASNPATQGQANTGYWRIGGDTLAGSTPNRPSSSYFAGTIDEVSIYPTALDAATVLAHYRASPAATP